MVGKVDDLIKWLLNQDRDKLFEVKEYKEKRSLNANAYAWLLIGKIADAQRLKKEDVYLQMLKDYGQSEIVSVLSSIDVSGYFKYYEPIAEVELQGKLFTHYRIIKGSSHYNTHEMSILIDGIVSECQQCGIDVMPDEEIRRLVDKWKSKE